MSRLTLSELNRRLKNREDVREDEVIDHLAAPGEGRVAALQALSQTRVRQAAELMEALAEAQSFTDQRSMNMLMNLVSFSGDELPAARMMLKMGTLHARDGDPTMALDYLSQVGRAWHMTHWEGPRAREVGCMLEGPEIDQAITALVGRMQGSYRTPEPVNGSAPVISIICSALVDDNAPTILVAGMVRELRRLGCNVRIVSTEHAPSHNSYMYKYLLENGFDIWLAPGETLFQRVTAIANYFMMQPVSAAVYVVTSLDVVAKTISELGIAKSQSHLNISYEHHCGKFDYVLHMVSEKFAANTHWGEKSKFIGNFPAIADLIESAHAEPRQTFGFPEHAIVLGTFGRMVKCSEIYYQALKAILEQCEDAYMLFAGHATDEDVCLLNSVLGAGLVQSRVRLLGPAQFNVPNLIKSIDIYLDSVPHHGGQSLLEAMYAGLPIVTMASMSLEGDAYGDVTLAAGEGLMPPGSELARFGDADHYAEIAIKYIEDPILRRTVGSALYDHVRTFYSPEQFARRLMGYLMQPLANTEARELVSPAQ